MDVLRLPGLRLLRGVVPALLSVTLFATASCTSPEANVGTQVLFVSPALISDPTQVQYLRLRIDTGAGTTVLEESVFQGAAAAALVRDCVAADVMSGAGCNPSTPDQVIEVPPLSVPTGRGRRFSAIVFFNSDPLGTQTIDVYEGASAPTDVLTGSLTVSINTALLPKGELSGQISCGTAGGPCAAPFQREHAAVLVTDTDTQYQYPLFNSFCTTPGSDTDVNCAGGEMVDGGYYAVRVPLGRSYSVRATLNGFDASGALAPNEAGRFGAGTSIPNVDPTTLDLVAGTAPATATVSGQVFHSNGATATVGLQNTRVTLEQLSFDPFADPPDTLVFQFIANLGAATTYVFGNVPPGTHPMSAEFLPSGDVTSGTAVVPSPPAPTTVNFTFVNVAEDPIFTFPAGLVPGDALGMGGLSVSVIDIDGDTDSAPGTDTLSGFFRNITTGETEAVTLSESGTGQFIVNPALATALGTLSDGNDSGTLVVRSGQSVELVVTDPVAFDGQTNVSASSAAAGVANRAPVLGAISDPAVVANTPLALPTITASDPDAPVDSLSYSLTGTLPTGVTLLDNGDGTADFVGTPTAAGTFNVTVIVSDNGVTPLQDSQAVSFSVSPSGGAATQLLITVQPPASTAAGATFGLTVEARDGSNLLDASYGGTVTLSAVGGTGSLSGTVMLAAVNGVATFSGLSYDTAETIQIQASAGGLSSDTSASVTVTPGAATQLVLGTASSASVPVSATWPTFTVEVQDAFGNLVASDNTTVVSIISVVGTVSGPTSLTGTTSRMVAGGVAMFDDISHATVEDLSFDLDDGGALTDLGGQAVSVTAGAATQLVIGTAPSVTETAGATWTSFTVEVQDALGNVVTSDNSTVVSIINTSGSITATPVLSGTTSKMVAGGVAVFDDISYDVAEDLTFDLDDGGALTDVAGEMVTILHAAASQLVYTTQPLDATTDDRQTVVVEIQDTFGNVVDTGVDSTVAVGLVIGMNPGGASLRDNVGAVIPSLSVAAASGVATFSGVTAVQLDAVGIGYDLDASATLSGPGLVNTFSSSFMIDHGAADHLAFGTAPAAGETAGALWTAFTVEILDAFDNVTSSDSATMITLAGDGTAVNGGFSNNVATVSAGAASFASVSYLTAETFNLSAMGAALPFPSPVVMTIDPAAANQVSFLVQPPAQTQRRVLWSFTAAQIIDAYGNRLSADNTSVVDFNLDVGQGALGGTLTRTASSGVVVFDDITHSLDEPIQVSLSSGGLISTPSIQIDVGPAPEVLEQSLERISLNSFGDEGGGGAAEPVLSADGRYVAYMSFATDNVPIDANGLTLDIIVRDLILGKNELVNVDSSGVQAPSGDSSLPSISADGRYVAFESLDTNLVASDTNGFQDIFVRDRVDSVTRRVSVSSMGTHANGASSRPSISANGRYVAFTSISDDLVVPDTNSATDIFVHDLLFGTTVRVSVDASGTQGNASSDAAAISQDGRYVAFHSDADNLVAGDTNGARDVFVHDRDDSGNGIFDEPGDIATYRVSVNTVGGDADSSSEYPSLSADGRFVAFESSAGNLVGDDTNGMSDAFVYDRLKGKTRRVSRSSSGAESDGFTFSVNISADGLWASYETTATNLGEVYDFNGQQDVYATNLVSGKTHLVSSAFSDDGPTTALADGGSFQSALTRSGDTLTAVFVSQATNLEPDFPDTNGQQDIYMLRVTAGQVGDRGSIRRLSLDENFNEAAQGSQDVSVNETGEISAFVTTAALVAGDLNGIQDIYAYDRDVRKPILVSQNAAGNGGNNVSGLSFKPALSRNGRFVVFDSDATDLSTDPDAGGATDVFLRDLLSGTTEKISVNYLGNEADDISGLGAVSDNGRFVAFASQATDILPPGADLNVAIDTFVRDRLLGTTQRVSVQDIGFGGGESDGDSLDLALSADGRYVAFTSFATNLLGGADTNGASDIFVHDRLLATTERVSIQDIGQGGGQSDNVSDVPALSADGRYVVFQSTATNLIGIGVDLNSAEDIFVHDRMSGATELISLDAFDMQPLQDSSRPTISDDGRYVAFHTQAAMVGSDLNGINDVYIRDRALKITDIVSVDRDGVVGNQTSQSPAISGDGRIIVFASTASNLVSDDTNGVEDVFSAPNPLLQGIGFALPNELVSVSDVTSGSLPGDGANFARDLSTDGRMVLFSSQSTNLHFADSDATEDIFIYDRLSQRTVLVSVASDGTKSNGASTNAAINGTARYVAFESTGTNLVGADGNGVSDVFVRDLLSGDTKRVSEAFGGGDANGPSFKPDVSLNGRYVAFESDARNLTSVTELALSRDVYVHDLLSGLTERVSEAFGGGEATGNSSDARISADGRYVAYQSLATDIVPGDTNASADVFVYDRLTKLTVRVSLDSFGSEGNGVSTAPSISADGETVAFASSANNLVSPATTPGRTHIYVHDLDDATTVLVSAAANGTEGNGDSVAPSINGFGEIVAFETQATNLSRSSDLNAAADIVVKNLRTGSVDRASYVSSFGIESDGASSGPIVAQFEPYVAFSTTASNLLTGSPGEILGNPDVLVASLPLATIIDPLFAEAPGSPLATSTNPVRLAAGDVNEDGRPDLLVANNVSNSISIFTGGGTGAFAFYTGLPTGNAPSQLELADFDRDGHLDVAVVLTPANAVGLFLGDGAGNFAAAPLSPFAAGTSPQGLTVGDFDRDGALDVATANQSSNNVVVLLGDGAGDFPSSIPTSVGGSPSAIAAADFDADGILDVVTPSGGTSVNIYLGNGSGGFTPGPANPYAMSGSGISWIAAGRLDSDGTVDIVTANSGSNDISVRLGLGNGDFAGVSTFPVGSTPRAVVLADLDLDGVTDAAVANDASGNASVLLGDGGGGFFPDFNDPYPTGAQPYGLVVADFNLDSRPDLVSANLNPNNATVLINQTYLSPARRPSDDGLLPAPIAPSSGIKDMASGDFDKDGDLDLVVTANATNEVVVLENLGGGAFSTVNTIAAATEPRRVEVGDVNGDGDLDLLVANNMAFGTTDLFLGFAAFGFSPGTGPTVGMDQEAAILADFDRNGTLDTAVAYNGNQLALNIGSGFGQFFSQFSGSPMTVGSSLVDLVAADVNGDGAVDLLAADDVGGVLHVLLGAGDGTFTPDIASPHAMPGGGVPTRLAVGDFNHDGALDVATTISGAADSPAFFGDGTGDFSSNVLLNIGASSDVAVSDYDLDGNPDLVFSNIGGFEVKVMVGDGAGGFTPLLYGPYVAPNATGALVVGAFEGDVFPEAAVADTVTDEIIVLFNREY